LQGNALAHNLSGGYICKGPPTVNFNLYLEDATGKRLARLAEQTGRSRNALIREAIADWLARAEHKGWPAAVEGFEGVEDAPPFEQYRSHLAPADDDPLA
jgi:predicted transcriptional regulator